MKREWINLQDITAKCEANEDEFLTFKIPNSKDREKCSKMLSKEMRSTVHSMSVLIILGIILLISFFVIRIDETSFGKAVSLGFIVLGIILAYIGTKTLIPASKNLKLLKTDVLKYFVMDCEVYKIAYATGGADKVDTAVIKLCKNDTYLDKEFVVDLNLYHQIKDGGKINITLIKLGPNYYVC